MKMMSSILERTLESINVRLFEHFKKEAVSQRIGRPSDGLSFHMPGQLSACKPLSEGQAASMDPSPTCAI